MRAHNINRAVASATLKCQICITIYGRLVVQNNVILLCKNSALNSIAVVTYIWMGTRKVRKGKEVGCQQEVERPKRPLKR